MKLIKAIRTAHKLKDGKLDVKHFRSFSTYNWRTDIPYRKYCDAMSIIAQHKIIKWTLRKLGVV